GAAPVLGVERAAEGALGSLPAQHRVLRRGQLPAPLGVAAHDLETAPAGRRHRGGTAAGACAEQAGRGQRAANAQQLASGEGHWAVSRQERHGHAAPGAINESSRGVKFSVTHRRRLAPTMEATPRRPDVPMNHAKRVLIVEDDAHIAHLLRMHLRDEGYEVTHAATGDEGLRLLENDTWSALVLDLMLPGVDGLEICRRARAMTRYTPIIITSARASEVHRILGLELGADDYLAKPFSMLELVARVKALLRRAEAMAQNARIEAGAVEV